MNKQFIKNAIAWVLFSSKNAQKVSLTVKAFALSIITLITVWTGVFHFQFDSQDSTIFVNNLVTAIQKSLEFIGYVGMIYGSIRKINNSVTGKNDVINTLEK